MSEQETETTPAETPAETTDDEETGERPALEHQEEDEAAEEEEQGERAQVEGVPAEPEGLSQKQLEAAFGKLERETERHGKRVAEIMGEDAAMLVPCPLCDDFTPGFVMPTPATPERFPAVREFMGDAQQRQLKPDPDTSQCEVCGGEGMLDMLSKVQGQEALVCGYCGGKGWVGTRHQSATSGPMAVQPLPDANGHTESGPPAIDPPDVAELKRKGYTIIPPVAVS